MVWLVTMTRQLAWYHRSAGVHEAAAGGPDTNRVPGSALTHIFVLLSLSCFLQSPFVSLTFSLFLSFPRLSDKIRDSKTPYEVTW